MRTNHIKQKLAKGEPCRGVWLGLPSPFSVRVLAQLPVDWLMIDAEHSPVDALTLSQMVSAMAESSGPAPFVRVPDASVENMKRTLDAGAFGLLAPMINTRKEAEQVVAWSKYPPEGQRSFGNAYAGFSFGVSMGEYLRFANEQTIIAIQIESKDALGNLDDLFSVPGYDMVFVGPVDLSVSLGLEPIAENPSPVFKEALDEIKGMARKHKLPMGIYCSDGASARKRIEEGFLFVNVTSDLASLTHNAMVELEASK
jgi:4-hydroxy-2-oxoheptanedioate aldolase